MTKTTLITFVKCIMNQHFRTKAAFGKLFTINKDQNPFETEAFTLANRFFWRSLEGNHTLCLIKI